MIQSIVSLMGLGLIASVVLAIASKIFAVEENPKVEALTEALPGANCGGCGYASCEAYATALVLENTVPTTLCVVGDSCLPSTLASISGKEAGDVTKQIAFRHCSKVEGNVATTYMYHGYSSCTSISTFDKGFDACKYSCLGLGDCVGACPFNAMEIVNGLVTIYKDACTGCNTCVEICPRDVLTLAPITARVNILCSTQDKAKNVMSVCEVGCISCSKCIKACPANAVSFDQYNRIRIDHKSCIAYGSTCNEACVDSCPRTILRSAAVDYTPRVVLKTKENENEIA